MHPGSVNVVLASCICILTQQTSVVAKLVTSKMRLADENAAQEGGSISTKTSPFGSELSDFPEHLEFLVQDTSAEPEVVHFASDKAEIAPMQAASTSEQSAGGRKGMRGTTEDIRANLIDELIGTFREGANRDRLSKWEASMAAMFTALPKNAQGNLGHAAAKYALHRAFVQQHSWSMSGFEPSDATWNVSSPLGSLNRWVPEYLLGLIEQLLGTQGINLRELAVLSATFEDLAHKEAINRLREIYKELSLPTAHPLNQDMAQRVIQIYMTMYTSANGDYVKTFKDVVEKGLSMDDETEVWLEKVYLNMRGFVKGDDSGVHRNAIPETLDFATTTRIVEEIGERFGSFNDKECRALKSILRGMETPRKPGRVALSDFYKEGMSGGYWNFNEKVEYLRILGALDETDSAKPQLIIPNYIYSRSNCIAPSNFYHVCCRNECENLLGHLENEVGAPMADPKKIADLISSLPSDTIKAPRNLPGRLVQRLDEIAQTHNGKVLLHSRMFSQWMHHAFPRECPYPHLTDENPQTPDEWMKQSGSKEASEEEMLRHINSRNLTRSSVTLSSHKEGNAELPWSSVDRFIDEHHQSVLFKQSVEQLSSGVSWLRYAGLIAVFVFVFSCKAISNTYLDSSHLKKFDSDMSDEHKFNFQGLTVQPSPQTLKQRYKREDPIGSCPHEV